MNWSQAVQAMRDGHIVRLQSERWRKVIRRPETAVHDESKTWDEAGITENGLEGCFLAHAWTADEIPVQVFMGALSKQLFVPEDEHRNANDWVIVERGDA